MKDRGKQTSDGIRMKSLVVLWNPTQGKKLHWDADVAQTYLPCDRINLKIMVSKSKDYHIFRILFSRFNLETQSDMRWLVSRNCARRETAEISEVRER